MSALSELSDYIEAQRERLHQALSQIMVYNRWACDHNIDALIEAEYDEALRKIDAMTNQLGIPWQVGITTMVRSFEAQVAWIIKEIEGEEAEE